MVKQHLLLFLLIILLSHTALAAITSSGDNFEMSCSAGQCTILTGDMKFIGKSNNLIEISKGGLEYEAQGLVLKTDIGETTYLLKSWDADWSWEILSDSDSNKTILGTATYQGLVWEQQWTFLKGQPSKELHRLTNNTGYDLENTEMFYVSNVTEQNLTGIKYVDDQDQNQFFSFSTDENVYVTGNLNEYYSGFYGTGAAGDYEFLWDDLINDGFDITMFFFGQLNDLDETLPATKGYALRVTKGGTLADGATIVLDPKITSTTSFAWENQFAQTSPAIIRVDDTNIMAVFQKEKGVGDLNIFHSDDNGVTWSPASFVLNEVEGLQHAFSAIAYEPVNKKVYVVWQEQLTGIGDPLRVREGKYDTNILNESSWELPIDVNLSDTLGDIGWPAIDVNSGGGVHILHFRQETDRKLVWTYGNADENLGVQANWTEFVIADSLGAVATSLSMDIDPDDNILVTVNYGGSAYFYSYSNVEGDWNGPTVLNGTAASTNISSITSTGDNNIYVAIGNTGSTPDMVNLMYREGGGAWIEDTNIAFGNTGWLADFPVITAKSDGNFIVTFTAGTSAALAHVYYSEYDNVLNTFATPEFMDDNVEAFSQSYRFSCGKEVQFRIDCMFLDSNTGNFEFAYHSNSVSFAPPAPGVWIDANFTYSPNPVTNLNPDGGVTSVSVDFNDISDYNSPTSAPTGWRWDENGVTFSTDQNVSHAFTAAGDYNICLDVNASNGGVDFNDLECKTVSVTQNPQGVSYTSYLSTYNADNNVLVDFNSFSDNDGAGVNYYWFKDGVIVSTDENTTIDFNTAGDFNVTLIVEDNDANGQYNDTRTITKTLMKIPKNESNEVNITPFDFYVYSSPDQNFDNLTSDTNFFLFGETVDEIQVLVDANADYYARYYYVDTDGTYKTIQPYLIKTTDGVSTTIVTQSIIDLTAIPDVEVEIYRSFPGGTDVLVEKVITDAKGEALISGITNESYNFKVYYNDALISDVDVTVTSTDIIIKFNPLTGETIAGAASVFISFDPTPGQIPGGQLNLIQSIGVSGTVISQIDINVGQDINMVGLYNITLTDANGISSGYDNYISIGSELGAWDTNYCLDVNVFVTMADDNVMQRHATYCFSDVNRPSHWAYDALQTTIMVDLGCEAGKPCSTTIILSLLLTVIISAGVVGLSPLRGPVGVLLIAAIPLGFFTMISWFEVWHYVIYCIISVAAIGANMRSRS